MQEQEVKEQTMQEKGVGGRGARVRSRCMSIMCCVYTEQVY